MILESKKQVEFWNSVINPDNITVGRLNLEKFDLEKNLAFYYTSIQKYAYGLVGDLKGKRVLELGCGLGLSAVIMAKKKANVTAIDIAPKRVQWVNDLVKRYGLTDINAICMSAEDMSFAEGSFDIIYSNEVLIHTDRKKVLAGCARLLTKGGKAIFIESLRFNPLINIYRNTLGPRIFKDIAKHMTLREIRAFKNFFHDVKHEEFYLLSPLGFFWQFGIQNLPLFRLSIKVLNSLDKLIFSCFPFTRYFAWMSCIECIK